LIKYSLLVITLHWHHNVSWGQAAGVNWCCQLLPCFDGELNLVR